MLSTDTTPVGNATLALAHFFVGLMKADGTVSNAEIRKVAILAHKFQYGLPCGEEEIVSDVREINESESYLKWYPNEHLEGGFGHFDKFVESGQANEDHMKTIMEMLEILAEVDGVTDSERLYLNRIHEGFLKRYGVDSTAE